MKLHLLRDLSLIEDIEGDDLFFLKHSVKSGTKIKVYVDNVEKPTCFATRCFYPNDKEISLNISGRNRQFLDSVYKKLIQGRQVFLCAVDLDIADYLQTKCNVRIFTKCRTVVYDGRPLPTLPVPDGLTLGKVKKEYIGCVIEHHQYGGTFAEIKQSVQHLPSVALYSGDKMVCWALMHCELSIGPLFTLEEYRGKGLAPVVLAELSRQLLQMGILPYSYITIGNTSSEALLKKVCGKFLPMHLCWCVCNG